MTAGSWKRETRSQAAELAEPDDEVVDDDVEEPEDVEEPDDADADFESDDAELLLDFDAGLLLDEAPRESLR